jgi:hypothetical protein
MSDGRVYREEKKLTDNEVIVAAWKMVGDDDAYPSFFD